MTQENIPRADSGDESVPPSVAPSIQHTVVKPRVTYWIIGITVVIYLLQVGSQALTGYDIPFLLGGKINELILRGELWRLITPVFLHGSWLHIGFNMYALYVMGKSLEEQFGHVRFLMLYLTSGFAGNVLSFVFSPNPSLGSSTAIFGILAAEGVFIYQNRKLLKDAKKMLLNTVGIAAVNFIIGLSTAQIDNLGHLGGLLGGLVFTWIAGPVWEIQGLHPVYQLVDRRPKNRTWTATIVMLFLFSAVAAFPFFAHR